MSLSDKCYKYYEADIVLQSDIKKAVKELKKKLVNPVIYQCGCCQDNEKIIDKIFGDDLI